MFEPHDPEPRVDRTAFSAFSVFSSFEQAEAADDAYWRSRTPAERLAHLELLRRINYGDAAAPRMEEVLEIDWVVLGNKPVDPQALTNPLTEDTCDSEP